MNVVKLSLVPLQQANLCMDCDMISAAHTHCLGCGSAALLNLARSLNGEECGSPMRRTLATVTNISDDRTFEPHVISAKRSQTAGGFAGECLAFPQLQGEMDRESHGSHWWRPLREVAAVVQRAVVQRTVTAALVGILLLGVAAKVRGHSVSASNGQPQLYGTSARR